MEPPGWGDDPLTDYLNNYRENQFATFDQKKAAMADLIRIDGLFLRLKGTLNPKPQFPMNFFLRAHSAYRASCGAVMAGQLYEAHASLRLCLEHAAYGFYVGDDEARWDIWLARGDDQTAKQAVIDEFRPWKIKKHIRGASQTLGDQFETLYEQLIDYGAHPNEQGFAISWDLHREDDIAHLKPSICMMTGCLWTSPSKPQRK